MPCTTILVGKRASYDGSTMIARNDDAGGNHFTAKKYVIVHPEEQPKVYKSVISHIEIPLPEPVSYTHLLTIGAIEDAIEKSQPDFSVRRGFTSQIIIDPVKKRDNVVIDNVTEALDRAVKNGVKTLVIQPTHLMNGLEYTDLVNEIAENADSFEQVAVGEPLLTSDADFKAVIQAITDATKEYDDGETAICFMGHGTEAESNQVYAKMQDMLTEEGFEHYYVGTVEATPSLDDVLAKVKEGSYKKVVLEPLMIVAGDHANNDMAGDEEGSWKTTFEEAGYEVTCLVRGLGELEPIQQLFVEHAKAAVDSLAK